MGCCEYDNENLCSIKGSGFLDQTRDSQLATDDFIARNKLVWNEFQVV
jgi:hypothetical protein